jgi:flagellar hook-basal body protein
MLDAITASQLAMDMDQLKFQSISQNIANMNTPGFKKQAVEQMGFDEHLQPEMSALVSQTQPLQIKTQGSFSQTRNPNDLAISGEGYFQVQSDKGIFYTRRGDFSVNAQGELATATGEILLGHSGALRVHDNAFTVNAQGALIMDHHPVDQLNIMQYVTLVMAFINPMNLPHPAMGKRVFYKALLNNRMSNPLMK